MVVLLLQLLAAPHAQLPPICCCYSYCPTVAAPMLLLLLLTAARPQPPVEQGRSIGAGGCCSTCLAYQSHSPTNKVSQVNAMQGHQWNMRADKAA